MNKVNKKIPQGPTSQAELDSCDEYVELKGNWLSFMDYCIKCKLLSFAVVCVDVLCIYITVIISNRLKSYITKGTYVSYNFIFLFSFQII